MAVVLPPEERIPPVSDVRWVVWSRPMLKWLQKHGPASWRDIIEWSRATREQDSRARQILAYLEVAGEASATRKSDGVWIWFASGFLGVKRRRPRQQVRRLEQPAFWASYEDPFTLEAER